MSDTPFADSQFTDLVKERDRLQRELSEAKAASKTIVKASFDASAVMAEENRILREQIRLQADCIKRLEDQLVGKP